MVLRKLTWFFSRKAHVETLADTSVKTQTYCRRSTLIHKTITLTSQTQLLSMSPILSISPFFRRFGVQHITPRRAEHLVRRTFYPKKQGKVNAATSTHSPSPTHEEFVQKAPLIDFPNERVEAPNGPGSKAAQNKRSRKSFMPGRLSKKTL